MIRLVFRSAVTLVAAVFLGSLAIFLALHTLGGDAASVILGKSATPESLARLRQELGLTAPLKTQYWTWISGFVQGDLGRSYASGYDVYAAIRERIGLTLSLATISLVVSSVVGLVAGTYSALHSRDRRGTMVEVTAQFCLAIPAFWSGVLLIWLFAIRLGWLPAAQYVPWSVDVLEAARSLTLPLIALTIPVTAVLIRYFRSAMLEVVNEDYIRTAMAKGQTLRRAVVIHGVRNAAIPMVTVMTLEFGALIGGTIIIESVFALPGIGTMLVQSMRDREVIVVQSLAVVLLAVVLSANFIMDICYGLLDPRIRDAGRVSADAR